ncbi:hypothetical protein GGH99_005180 [Coemansia sp. RSA 1285]|nr:hypothetical protein EV177_008421 [Coemansia sp. RSA 1804]KAJ2681491.1 hypothetical protein GGH99_005180 [Coemansia sp. RSA 1285]
MYDYPPATSRHNSSSQGGRYADHSRYTQATGKLAQLTGMAKRRRHDISIAIQSALSAIYAVELVFYFVRLRHLSGSHAAAWRASLMLSLLIIDICLVWLTVRSKKQQMRSTASPNLARFNRQYEGEQHAAGYAGNLGVSAPEPGHDPAPSNPFANMPMDRLGNPLPPPGDMPAHPHNQQQFYHEHQQNHLGEHRSRLNTPITE